MTKSQIVEEIKQKIILLSNYYNSDIMKVEIDLKKSMKSYVVRVNVVEKY